MISVQKRVVLFDNLKKECQKLNISIRSSDKIFLQTDILILDILSLANLYYIQKINLTLHVYQNLTFFM